MGTISWAQWWKWGPLAEHSGGNGVGPLAEHSGDNGVGPLAEHSGGNGVGPLAEHSGGNGVGPLAEHSGGNGVEPLAEHSGGNECDLLTKWRKHADAYLQFCSHHPLFSRDSSVVNSCSCLLPKHMEESCISEQKWVVDCSSSSLCTLTLVSWSCGGILQ